MTCPQVGRRCAAEATGLCGAGCATGYVVRVGFSRVEMIGGGARALHAGSCSRVRAAVQSGAYKSTGWAWRPYRVVCVRLLRRRWRHGVATGDAPYTRARARAGRGECAAKLGGRDDARFTFARNVPRALVCACGVSRRIFYQHVVHPGGPPL